MLLETGPIQSGRIETPFLDLFFRDQSVIDDPDFQEEAQEELRDEGLYDYGVEDEFVPPHAGDRDWETNS